MFFVEEIFNIIREMVALFEGKSTLEITILIFLNNFQASFMSMFFGILIGFFPVLISVINGYLIGFTINLVVAQEGAFILWRLFPHGVFELPAIILSIGLGIFLGGRFLDKKFKIKKFKTQMMIITLVSLFFGLIGIWYTSIAPQVFGVLEGELINPLLLGFISIFNLIILSLFLFVSYSFFKDKELRRDFISSIWFFILIILPLLVIAGIIEGILVGMFS